MKASEILSDESRWCKYAYAKDSEGLQAVKPGETLDELMILPSACKFCMVAAVYIAQGSVSLDGAKATVKAAIRKTFPFANYFSGEDFNNSYKFEDIRKVLVDNDL